MLKMYVIKTINEKYNSIYEINFLIIQLIKKKLKNKNKLFTNELCAFIYFSSIDFL